MDWLFLDHKSKPRDLVADSDLAAVGQQIVVTGIEIHGCALQPPVRFAVLRFESYNPLKMRQTEDTAGVHGRPSQPGDWPVEGEPTVTEGTVS